jgi:anti-anti-sigma factor
MNEHIVAGTDSLPLADRAGEKVGGISIYISGRTADGITIVAIAGSVNRHAAGRLYDALVGCIGSGDTRLIVDLSGVHLLTHAGMRGLVVAAKLAAGAGGALRICGAERSIEAFLQGLGFNHLLKCDPTLQASVAALSGGTPRAALFSSTAREAA